MRLFLSCLFSVTLLGCGSGPHENVGGKLHEPSDRQSEATDKGAVLEKGNPNPRHCLVMGGQLGAEALSEASLQSVHEGKIYYFCCEGCKPKFEENPGQWIANPAKPRTGGHAGHHQ